MASLKPYVDFPGVLNMAHRGGAGQGPENTLVAFRQALEDGADVFELDVHSTKDGHIVVHHDPTLQRTAGVPLKICETPLEVLKAYDVAQPFRRTKKNPTPLISQALTGLITMPTLEEVFAEFPTARINIDIKPKRGFPVSRLVRLIEERGMVDRVLVVSQYRHYLRVVRRLNSQIATGLAMSEVFWLRYLPGYRVAGDALQIGRLYYLKGLLVIGRVSKGLVDRAHQKGLKVHVFITEGKENLPEEERMERERADMISLLELGVDGIITDYPALLRQLLQTSSPPQDGRG